MAAMPQKELGMHSERVAKWFRAKKKMRYSENMEWYIYILADLTSFLIRLRTSKTAVFDQFLSL